MEVKPGYKQTEVGVIPEEWEVEPCRRVSKVITVGIVVKPTQYYQKHGVPALRSANIRENRIDKSDLIFISEEANIQQAKSQVKAGDVVTVRTGYPGTSAVVPPDMSGSNCIDILITRPSERLDSTFLSAWINSPRGKDQVLRSQNGLAQQHFNVGDLRELFVAIPPLPEQRAIAETLRDVDGLLGGLERLIAKKRDLKQAAMQQLLTGKKRLPGFESIAGYKETEVGLIPEEWNVKPLGSVLSMGRLGGNYPNREREADYPLMKMGNIARGFIDTAKIEYIVPRITPDPKHRLCYGDVLFNTRNTLDLVGKVAIWRNELPFAYYNSNLMRLEFEPREVCSNEYANYALNTPGGIARLRALATGTTSVAAIYTRDLLRTPFIVPPLPEQCAIAGVLSDMDAEIAALEARCDKTRALKHGMMQGLLTGRTRLI
jgi:type I restriction enzyme, S subunit